MSNPNHFSGDTEPTDTLDPAIMQLAEDPLNRAGVSDTVRKAAFTEAKRLAGQDKMNHKRFVRKEGNEGTEAYWATEFPNVFTFDGFLRGHSDLVHRDYDQRSTAQHIHGDTIGGEYTHVIIKTDADESVVVRKTTPDTLSARKQEFDLVSTTMAEKAGAEKVEPRSISTGALANVVLVPGHPMRLGMDETTGKAPRTRGNITSITGLKMNDENRIAPNHPILNRPEKLSHARDEHLAKMNEAHRRGMGQAALRSHT